MSTDERLDLDPTTGVPPDIAQIQAARAPRYTVRMLGSFVSDLDIDGVCLVVRDALESGLIPVIEIDTQEGK